MTKTEKIKRMIEIDSSLPNRVIAESVGCTRRMVRHVRGEVEEKRPANLPKILIFDIETAPMEIYAWGLYKQHPGIQQVIKDWSLLSWSAKWLFDSNIISRKVTGKEAFNRDDTNILPELWELINQADILVGHNIQSFDIRKVNLRFALMGLMPPMPYRVIDTYKTARRVFNSASFKMDYLNKIFGLDMKDNAPYEWWKGAAEGDDECIAKMAAYNETDVRINEELYLKIRPWIKSHPNLGLYINTEETVCTYCTNENLTWGGHYYTPAGKYRTFRCDSCGAIGRSRTSDIDKETRARLLLSLAS